MVNYCAKNMCIFNVKLQQMLMLMLRQTQKNIKSNFRILLRFICLTLFYKWIEILLRDFSVVLISVKLCARHSQFFYSTQYNFVSLVLISDVQMFLDCQTSSSLNECLQYYDVLNKRISVVAKCLPNNSSLQFCFASRTLEFQLNPF